MPRFYEAASVDRYLHALRARFNDSINTVMATTQRSDDPRIEGLKSVEKMVLAIQAELTRYAVDIEPIVPASASIDKDVVDAEEVVDDDVPFQEIPGGTA